MIHEYICPQSRLDMNRIATSWNKRQGILFTLCKFYFVCFQATPQKLISHVVADHSAIDPTYVEDLLLTYKTFLDRPSEICSQLLNWFLERRFRDKVRLLLRLDDLEGWNDFVVVVVHNLILLVGTRLVDSWLIDSWSTYTWLVVDCRWRAQCFSGSIIIMVTLKGTRLWRITWRPSKRASNYRWAEEMWLVLRSVPSCV